MDLKKIAERHGLGWLLDPNDEYCHAEQFEALVGDIVWECGKQRSDNRKVPSMGGITAGLLTPEQANRDAEFLAAVARLRADGHFTTTTGVGVGEAITIEFEGKKRNAVVAWAKAIDDGLPQIFFRWTDETPNEKLRGASDD